MDALTDLKAEVAGSLREVTGLVAANSIDFVRRAFALHDAETPTMILRSADDSDRLEACPAVSIVTPETETGWAELSFVPRDGSSVAQILFTSGTTGRPKPIILTQSNISNTTVRLVDAQQLDDTVREYIGVPVTYSFGMGRCRAVSAVGGKFYISPHGFDLIEMLNMIKAGEVNAFSLVPTLLRLVLDSADLVNGVGELVKWIEIGSQPLSIEEKHSVRRMFPNAVILQHYGLTEASRTTFLRIDNADEDALASVGAPSDDIELRLSDDQRIEIRGPHVAHWTLKDGQPAALTDSSGWLTTGDHGSIRDGHLYFEGRADDLINCSGVKLVPETFEAALANALPHAADLAVCAVPDALRGDNVLVSFVPTRDLTVKQVCKTARPLGAEFGIPAAAITVQAVDEIPRTQTGKTQRRILRDAYLNQDASDPVETSLPDKLVALWRTALQTDDVDTGSDFFAIGGDTLSAELLVSDMTALGLEEGLARSIFDGATIADIAANAESGSSSGGDVGRQILAIWQEALDREDVATNLSFYDVGGDSLSAVKVALGMERAGLDPELAMGIFDGLTIEELTKEAGGDDTAPSSISEPAQRSRKTEVAVLSEAANFLKGLVLLCMIGSHWMPVYLVRFGLSDTWVSKALAPIFSLGSPTLAFAFGMGASIFYLRQYESHSASFMRNVRMSGLLLAIGVLIGGLADIASTLVQHPERLSFDLLLFFVENPFVYYFLAAISLPLWVGLLRRSMIAVQAVLLAALVSYGVHLGMFSVLPAEPTDPAIAALRNMLVGHWGLFQMFSLTLLGAAFGLGVETVVRSGGRLSSFKLVGGSMILLGLVISVAYGDAASWLVFPKLINLASAIFYSGVAVLLIALFPALSDLAAGRAVSRVPIEWVCSIGVLLFPLYVAQSLVYHTAAILDFYTPLAFTSALSVIIILYVALMYYPVWRIHRLYYGGRKR